MCVAPFSPTGLVTIAMGCCSSVPKRDYQEATPSVDVRNGLMIDVVKREWLRRIAPSTKTAIDAQNSTTLSTCINQASIENLQSCGIAAAAVSGLLLRPTMFFPHEPVRGIKLRSQYLDSSGSAPQHHLKPGEFDVHCVVLDHDGSGTVVELCGNAHMNPFSEDPRLPSVHMVNRDGTCEQLRWYFYKYHNLDWLGPILDESEARTTISLCAVSHFKKFGDDHSTLCVLPQDSLAPQGARPWELPGASSVALEMGAAAAAAAAATTTHPQTSASAGLIANQHQLSEARA